MSELSWQERIEMLSIHPDAAHRDDIARLAADLMEARRLLGEFLFFADEDINQNEPDRSCVTPRYLAAWKKAKELTAL